MNKGGLIGTLALVVTLSGVCLVGCQSVDRDAPSGEAVIKDDVGLLEAVKVDYVVDGDTLRVVDTQGTKYYVRLIGIDAPESVSADEAKNCPEGEAASDYLKTLVTSGQTVYLERDVSDRDKYDRLLRYVWLQDPPSTPTGAEVTGGMLNAILVRGGYAQAKSYPPDTAFAELFGEFAQKAQDAGLGVTSKWRS